MSIVADCSYFNQPQASVESLEFQQKLKFFYFNTIF